MKRFKIYVRVISDRSKIAFLEKDGYATIEECGYYKIKGGWSIIDLESGLGIKNVKTIKEVEPTITKLLPAIQRARKTKIYEKRVEEALERSKYVIQE